jgi:hypothetical protein
VSTTATGTGSPANSPAFVPYVYGATRGTPSRGRPGRVLAAALAPETTVRRFERELAAMRGPCPATGNAAVREPCGTSAAYHRHLRAGEKPCEACRLAENADCVKRVAARKAKAAAVPAQAPAPAAAVRCRGCGYLETAPGHLVICGERAA